MDEANGAGETGKAIETTFARTFLRRELRDSWANRLANPKTRSERTRALAHTFTEYLDPNRVFSLDRLPDDIRWEIDETLRIWRRENPSQICRIIAYGSEAPEALTLKEARRRIDAREPGLDFGAIVIVVADVLAYYFPELGGPPVPPFYALFHRDNARAYRKRHSEF